ncbi:MAG: Zn-dependent hydrolase [Eubacteriaceae bacterium]|nr:Zn-dependent hydrolase [Eubacteriaceae bacterium]
MNNHSEWIVQAIETVGKTALRDTEYWRATYTPQDKDAVSVLNNYMKEAGMETYFDAVGNLFGRIPGRCSDTVLCGSHRDTVRQGGKYDGMLGILTAIRSVSSLNKELGQPEKSIEVVALCEEESSRFPTSYLGSRHICGLLKEEELLDLDDSGMSLGEAIRDAGYYYGQLSNGRTDITNFVELHIEQGGLMEYEKKQIGIVSAIVGLFTGEIVFKGQQNHAGTTPMRLRKDPVPVAAEFIYRLNLWAKKYQDNLVCTVGKIDRKPGNSNVICDDVSITFDIRSAEQKYLDEANTILNDLKKQLDEHVDIAIDITCNESPVSLDSDGIHILEKLVKEYDYSWKPMVSGAGHDSQIMAQKYKTNMIFVPSVNGISHSTKEFTKAEDIQAGCEIMKAFIKELAW